LEQPSAHGRPLDAGVMSRRDGLRTEPACALEQRGELQIAVAVRAGQRRAARDVLMDKVGDDRLLKPLLEIQDVMREPEWRGNTPRVIQVVERAAGAEVALVLGIELHGQTDDVMTLLGEQGRGDRGVDAS